MAPFERRGRRHSKQGRQVRQRRLVQRFLVEGKQRVEIFARFARGGQFGGGDAFEAQLGERGRESPGESRGGRDGREVGDAAFLAEQVDHARGDRLDAQAAGR